MRIQLILLWLFSVAASPATDNVRRLIGEGRNAEAFAQVEAAAVTGDEDAIALLGWFYDTGRHVPRDFARAAEYYRRVARDNPSVQWRLGVMYDLGQGVPEDPAEAFRLLRQAAAANYADAHASLGVMYANGRGARADYAQSMHHYRRAAELGSAAGFLGAGLLYQHGLGVDRSPTEAASWYLAADALRDGRARAAFAALNLPPVEIPAVVARANQLLQSHGRRERITDAGR